MAWNKQHKQQSRERILNAAAGLFVQHGFDGVGIDQVMAKAGMTRGAFYSHFQSKTDLYQHAMAQAAHNMFQLAQNCDGQLNLKRLFDGYLSDRHVKNDDIGCPLAFLVTDVAQQQPEIRDTYTRLFAGMARQISDTSQQPQDVVLQQMVMMIGGVAIARALSEPELQQQVLDMLRKTLSVAEGQH